MLSRTYIFAGRLYMFEGQFADYVHAFWLACSCWSAGLLAESIEALTRGRESFGIAGSVVDVASTDLMISQVYNLRRELTLSIVHFLCFFMLFIPLKYKNFEECCVRRHAP